LPKRAGAGLPLFLLSILQAGVDLGFILFPFVPSCKREPLRLMFRVTGEPPICAKIKNFDEATFV
jgi:hypothetical protein